MSSVLQTRHNAESPPTGLEYVDLPLFRFGLRQLLLFVAVVSLVLAVIVSSQAITGLAMLLAALVVLLHLFSTALGTQLRCHANRTLTGNVMSHDVDHRETVCRPVLRSNNSTTIATLTLACPGQHAIAVDAQARRGDGYIGWCGRRDTVGSDNRISHVPGRDPGGIGLHRGRDGWFAFLAGSFYGIFRHGFRDAVAEHKKDGAGGVR